MQCLDSHQLSHLVIQPLIQQLRAVPEIILKEKEWNKIIYIYIHFLTRENCLLIWNVFGLLHPTRPSSWRTTCWLGLRFAKVGSICVRKFRFQNSTVVLFFFVWSLLGKWKAPKDCLGNDIRNIAAENPSTHHPACFFPSKCLLYLNVDGALFKGCYRDQRENFQSLQAMSCWLLSHWRLVILHTIYICSLFFFGGFRSYHTYVCFLKLSLMSSCFLGFLQSAIETALPCNINNPTLSM